MRAVRALPDNWKWATGAHDPDSTGCIMEAVAYIAGEPWSDHPKCVDPALTEFAMNIWDLSNDATREKLKERLPRLLNTAGDWKKTLRRAYIAADWAVRVAAKLKCDPIVDSTSAYRAAEAAGAAARAAARAAAGAAAGAAWAAGASWAARAAVAAVAARAAGAAGEAWAAEAARAAGAAAGAAAWSKAVDCLDAMIEARET